MEKKETQSYYQQYLTIVLSVLIILTIILLIKLSSRSSHKDADFQISYASESALFEKHSEPKPQEVKPQPVKGKEESKKSEDPMEKENLLVDLNSATKEELMELPGVGPKMAEAMIQYREENKGFSSEKDLMNISGIGEKRYKRIEPFIKKISGSSSEDNNPAETNSDHSYGQKQTKSKTVKFPENSSGIVCAKCGQRVAIHKSREYHTKPYCPLCLSYLFKKTSQNS